jgi:hypothetical protein
MEKILYGGCSIRFWNLYLVSAIEDSSCISSMANILNLQKEAQRNFTHNHFNYFSMLEKFYLVVQIKTGGNVKNLSDVFQIENSQSLRELKADIER